MALDVFNILASTCWNEKFQPLTTDMKKNTQDDSLWYLIVYLFQIALLYESVK